MNGKPGCSCGASGRLVFACSGAADVGAVADRAARDLQSGMAAFMCCTAAVAAEVPDVLQRAREADRILAIDGCEEACARKILERAGFRDFPAIRLDEMGMQKGRTRPTAAAVDLVVARGRVLLSGVDRDE